MLKAGIVPSDALAVDVSTRILTSVVVVPVMGEMVGAVVGGSDVCVAMGVEVAGNFAVTNSCREMAGIEGVASQPMQNKKRPKKTLDILWFTAQLYPKTRLS